MTTITALPTPPSTSDPSTFDSRADAFIAALPTFVTETNTLAGEVITNRDAAASSNTASGVSAAAALASQNAAAASANTALGAVASAGAASGATIWVTATTYAQYSVRFDPGNGITYRLLTTAYAGTNSTTTPRLDPANWQSVIPQSVGSIITLAGLPISL